ncbi:uncharacterized protein LOC132197283 [Neocloeon triangulifer]|uniref:uncharacterized protein LOC132197283 n=1 Tax=Neocloeon triangulifer TaxID=2078957 RepID=UPI00286EDC7A|nr:uncharacterized protein LOC132197283 [Neocloeon triangulifer]
MPKASQMKSLMVIACLLAAAAAAADDGATITLATKLQAPAGQCYRGVEKKCDGKSPPELQCNSLFGGFEEHKEKMADFIKTNVQRNFQYLMFSTHFSNYEANRAGLEKLYRGLSDEAWNDAIELIKYSAKRGSHISVNATVNDVDISKDTFTKHEVGSLATVLDLHKSLAVEAHNLHKHFSDSDETKKQYDPDVSSFLENNFLSKHTETVRTLSGHTNDLINMLHETADGSLALFLFDEYLQKL